jgi:excisionase family DNA binding protein
MGQRRRLLTEEELSRPFHGDWARRYPPILSVRQLAALLNGSPKTIYEWIGKGRLDGAFRKRGKHILIWRDRALDLLFNAQEWADD